MPLVQVKINDVDKTDIVSSITKTDILNDQLDTCRLSILKYGDHTFVPALGDDVKLYYDSTLLFAGVIINLTKNTDAGGTVVQYEAEASDYGFYLKRQLVIEEYFDMTLQDIVVDIMTNYTTGFTTANVEGADLTIVSISFDRIPVNEALQRIAEATGYSWYVDETKDLHMFRRNTEVAPFNLTDGDGNFIPDSLEIRSDMSQLRNRVFVQGGDVVGDARTETFDGNGVKQTFKLGNKFSELPTVTVGGVGKTVGVDFLDDEASFDCFWNFNEKYIRFKATTIPGAGTDNVSVTGTPLYPVIVRVQNSFSIAEDGLWEFVKKDKNIKTKAEAIAYGTAEMEAYRNAINEGSFSTYTPGLRSGQIITITSPTRDITEDFLIQKVTFNLINQDQGVWDVDLATLKTIGMVQFLIDLLRAGKRTIEETADSTLDLIESFTGAEAEKVEVADSIVTSLSHNPQTEIVEVNEIVTPRALDYAVEFVLGDYPVPTGTKRQFVLDSSPLG